MHGRNSVIIALLVLLLIASLAIYQYQQSAPATSAPRGKTAPGVVTTTLDGQTWRLADQRGKVVLIDFWATWCGPCIAAMPHMKQIYERFRSDPDFLMVGVSLDDDPGPVRQFVQSQQIPWLQLYDPAQPFARAFNVGAIPSVWVIGREGQIAGGYLHGPDIEKTVAAELARK